jgi:hypothetical protein
MTTPVLPEPFEQLTPWVAQWALATERERYEKLHRSSIEELREFYAAMLPCMPEILAYLDRYTVSTMPDEARALFHLAMTFAETAHPIDLKWKDVDFESAYPWAHLEFRTVST